MGTDSGSAQQRKTEAAAPAKAPGTSNKGYPGRDPDSPCSLQTAQTAKINL